MSTEQIFALLYKNLSLQIKIPEDQWELFKTHLNVVTFQKGENIFTINDERIFVGFLIKGLAYSYYLKSDGKQFTKNFYWEGRLISPWASFLQNKPCHFTAEALEQTTVVMVSAEVMRQFEEKHICWLKLTKLSSERALIDREEREYNSLMLSTMQQYIFFQNKFSDIINRISQHQIASYLGISPVSLSRLKNKKY